MFGSLEWLDMLGSGYHTFKLAQNGGMLGPSEERRRTWSSVRAPKVCTHMSLTETIVFVFPHQDDEMFVFHRIRHLLRSGKRLFFVWVTDGAANNPEVRRVPFIRLFLPILARESDEVIRLVRAKESRSLMTRLGVGEERLRFLSLPSGQIKSCFDQVVDSLAALFRELRPREIYTVAFEHGEFEHDACNAAVRFAAREAGSGARLCEWPVFCFYKWRLRLHWLIPCDGAHVEYTPFTTEEERERLALFREMFPSQWFVAWSERIANRLFSIRRRREPYRSMPEHDYLNQIPGARVMYQPKSLGFNDLREIVSGYVTARGTSLCES